jgi:uncharacterized protein (DUF1778 family)
MVRLDAASKVVLAEAAKLRKISVSDYVRTIVVAQARREVDAAPARTIAMSPDEQLAFWKALNEPPKITEWQRKLGKLMQGKT